MKLLNRTQFAVLLFSYINTTIEHVHNTHGPEMAHMQPSLPDQKERLETLVGEGYTEYLNSPERLRDNFDLNDIAGISETNRWSEGCSKVIDVYFGTITVDEALELQRQLNWMGMEIDFSTRRVSRVVGGAV